MEIAIQCWMYSINLWIFCLWLWPSRYLKPEFNSKHSQQNVDCKLRVSGQRLLSLSVNVLYLYQKCRNLAVNVIIFIRDNLLDFIIDCLQIKKICLNQRNRLTISTYKKNRSIAVCFYANFQTKKNPHQMILCIFAEKTTKVRIQCGVFICFWMNHDSFFFWLLFLQTHR